MTENIITYKNNEHNQHTCVFCGHTGNDVHLYRSYFGGIGYEWYPECDDRIACWERHDKQENKYEGRE